MSYWSGITGAENNGKSGKAFCYRRKDRVRSSRNDALVGANDILSQSSCPCDWLGPISLGAPALQDDGGDRQWRKANLASNYFLKDTFAGNMARFRLCGYHAATAKILFPCQFQNCRWLNVLDDFNKEILAIEIDTSLTGKGLIRVFERLPKERHHPEVLRAGDRPEFSGNEFIGWAGSVGMMSQYMQPGMPNQTSVERFNRTERNEVLGLYWFNERGEARETTYRWMIEYKKDRSHDSLDDLTPAEYMMKKAENFPFARSTKEGSLRPFFL